MLNILKSLTLLALTSVTSAQTRPAFEWRNPLPQGNTLFAVQMVGPDIGFAAGEHGTIIRTTDGGTSWSILESGVTDTLYGLAAIDRDIVTAVGGNGVIIRTNDGGTTWRRQISGTSMRLRGVSFTGEDTGTAVGDDGTILHTSDGGITWMSQSPGRWANLSSVVQLAGGAIIAIGEAGTVLQTTNMGVAWRVIPTPTYANLNAIAFGSSEMGIIAGDSASLLRTQDGGDSWLIDSASDIVKLAPWHCVVFVDPLTAIVMNDEGLVLRTTDAGLRWVKELFPSPTPGVLGATWPVPDYCLAVGTSGLLLESNDSGSTWHVREGPHVKDMSKALFDISFRDSRSGIAIGDGHWILRTADGGSTWLEQSSDLTAGAYRRIQFIDSLRAFLVGDGIFRSADGGLNWDSQAIPAQIQRSFEGLFFVSRDTGYVVGTDGQILHTTDGGAHWLIQDSRTAASLRSIAFADALIGVAIGAEGTLLRTTDGGNNWYSVVPAGQFQVSFNGVVFMDHEHGIIVGADNGGGDREIILRTSDAGNTWMRRTSDSQAGLVGVHFGDRNHGIAMGAGGTVIRTTDGGETWGRVQSVTDHTLTAGWLSDSARWTIVGTGGIIAQTESAGERVGVHSYERSTCGPEPWVEVLPNFPNPFAVLTVIPFNVRERSHVTISILDAAGRPIEVLANRDCDAGNMSVRWAPSLLESGSYICRIEVRAKSVGAGWTAVNKQIQLLR